MPIERAVLPNMQAHPAAGMYVETFAGHHIYGRSGCFSCPELQLFGYMGADGIRRAILRVTGVPIVRAVTTRGAMETPSPPSGSLPPAAPQSG